LSFPDNRPHDISNESEYISGGLGFVDVDKSEARFGLNKYLTCDTTGFDSCDIFSEKTLELISKPEI
jgi:hypothetical protein